MRTRSSAETLRELLATDPFRPPLVLLGENWPTLEPRLCVSLASELEAWLFVLVRNCEFEACASIIAIVQDQSRPPKRSN
jgi:hypothetical protein